MPIPVEKDAALVREYEVLGSPDTVAYQTYRTPVTDYNIAGNSSDHFHTSDRSRANHTGTQVMATISDLPTLVAGTWSPTLTNTTNVAASTTYDGQYIRVGATVTCSGKVDIDPTAAAATVLEISLPVASNFGAEEDCAGTAVGLTTATIGAAISAEVTNNTAQLRYTAVDTGNKSFYYTFTYQIL